MSDSESGYGTADSELNIPEIIEQQPEGILAPEIQLSYKEIPRYRTVREHLVDICISCIAMFCK